MAARTGAQRQQLEESERLETAHPCPDGEIGRRKGLKIPRSKDHPGSSPGPGTMILKGFLRFLSSWDMA